MSEMQKRIITKAMTMKNDQSKYNYKKPFVPLKRKDIRFLDTQDNGYAWKQVNMHNSQTTSKDSFGTNITHT